GSERIVELLSANISPVSKRKQCLDTTAIAYERASLTRQHLKRNFLRSEVHRHDSTRAKIENDERESDFPCG
ncbi:MAG: hypothetical protein ABL996_10630, partial [Micropepsaceae bacterium]